MTEHSPLDQLLLYHIISYHALYKYYSFNVLL